MNEEEVEIAMEPVTQVGNNWDTFLQTGNIESYLMYKFAAGAYDEEEKRNPWRDSGRKALS